MMKRQSTPSVGEGGSDGEGAVGVDAQWSQGSKADDEEVLHPFPLEWVSVVLPKRCNRKVCQFVVFAVEMAGNWGGVREADVTVVLFKAVVQGSICLSYIELVAEKAAENVYQVGGLAGEMTSY